MNHHTETPAADNDRRRVAALATLFAMLYFIQGISEPTEGLLAQPTRSLLKNWGYSTGYIAWFMTIVGLPWAIKPLYGLVTDFVPLGGSRRRSWLLITSFVTSASLVALYFFMPESGEAALLLAWLMLPAVGVAFSDVVVDALMVEEGQPRKLTGLLQSVQWAAIYTATIITGLLGGYLSELKLQRWGFLIAGLATAASFFVAFVVVREPRRDPLVHDNPFVARETTVEAIQALWRAARHPGILAIGAFLFLWYFNPFSSTVLYVHMVRDMKFSEQFYGKTVSIEAVAAVLASVLYPFYSRRLSVGQLVHISIGMGVLATAAYWWLTDTRSAVVISFVVGFVYMTATIIQLDLAARVCDVVTAGTTFALLMSITNASFGISAGVGGSLYDWLKESMSSTAAFNIVVAIGAVATSFCWFLVPALRKYCATPGPCEPNPPLAPP